MAGVEEETQAAERTGLAEGATIPGTPGMPVSPTEPPSAGALPNRIGRFTVLERLGQGGMGVVYSAFDDELDRKVAIKLLRKSGGAATERLRREAQAMAKLSHPNVAQVYEVGSWNEQIYLAIEFVRGKTLKDWLNDAPSFDEKIEVLAQAGRGLQAAHRAGLVHRDFKPDNVMVGTDGRVRVLDFGLAGTEQSGVEVDLDTLEAKLLEHAKHNPFDSPLTETGTIMGTPAYMSPEQFRSGKVGAASDQFSFCLTAYEALYGERPFDGSGFVGLGLSVMRGEVKDPPAGTAVPTSVRQILLRGLKVAPEDRHPDMELLLAELHAVTTPATGRGWKVAAIALGVALPVGLLAGQLARPSTTEAPSLCTGAETKVASVWGDETERALVDAFEATGLSYAASTSERVSASLDSYARDWQTAFTDACEATRLRGEQSEQVMDARMRCLDRRLQSFDLLVQTLAEGDPNTVPKAIEAVAGLPAIERCADQHYVLSAVEPPQDEELAAKVEGVRRRIARVEALELSGRYAEGFELAKEVERDALEVDYPLVQAEIAFWVGKLAAETSNWDDVEPGLHRAFFDGRRYGDDELAARAGVALTRIIGLHKREPDAALVWAQHADAEVDRIDDPRLRSEFYNNRGIVLTEKGELEAALKDHSAALEIRRREFGPSHRSVGQSLLELGVTYSQMGDLDAAVEYTKKALDVMGEAIGRDHPHFLITVRNYAGVLSEAGRTEPAIAAFEEAAALYQRAEGADSLSGAVMLVSAASVADVGGMRERADGLWQRAFEIYARSKDPTAPTRLLQVKLSRASAMMVSRPDDAVAELEKLLPELEGHEDMQAQALATLGEGLEKLGENQEAFDALVRATTWMEAEPGRASPSRLSQATFASGRASYELGKRASGRTRVQHALELLPDPPTEGKDPHADLREACGQWLESHG